MLTERKIFIFTIICLISLSKTPSFAMLKNIAKVFATNKYLFTNNHNSKYIKTSGFNYFSPEKLQINEKLKTKNIFPEDINNIENTKILLENGAQIDNEENALIYACANNNLDAIKLILSYFPQYLHIPNSDKSFGTQYPHDIYAGRSLLWVAVANGNLEIAEYLISKSKEIFTDTEEELLSANCKYCKDRSKKIKNKVLISKVINKIKQ